MVSGNDWRNPGLFSVARLCTAKIWLAGHAGQPQPKAHISCGREFMRKMLHINEPQYVYHTLPRFIKQYFINSFIFYSLFSITPVLPVACHLWRRTSSMPFKTLSMSYFAQSSFPCPSSICQSANDPATAGVINRTVLPLIHFRRSCSAFAESTRPLGSRRASICALIGCILIAEWTTVTR